MSETPRVDALADLIRRVKGGDEPAERDVGAVALIARVWLSRNRAREFAVAFLTSDWYAERIAEAWGEGFERGAQEQGIGQGLAPVDNPYRSAP